MKKLTIAQRAAVATMQEHPAAIIVGDFITKRWRIEWKEGGFTPTVSVRDATVRGLIKAEAVTLSGSTRGLIVYKLKP